MKMKFPRLDPLEILLNNKPLDDYCGMTPNEIHHLLYRTFDGVSPLKLQTVIDNRTLDNIPFFRLTEELMKIGQRENYIKLTSLGSLSRKVLHELYGYKFIPEDHIEAGISKLTREHNSPSIMASHFNAIIMRVFAEVKGKLILTTFGNELLKPENRVELLKTVLTNYTNKFNWALNDSYTDYPVGQFGWGYTIYLLYKFGDTEMTKQFYADMYLRAFPKFIEEFPARQFSTSQRNFTNCYRIRSFDRFAEWFGFVKDMTKSNRKENENYIIRTDVLAKVFYFEI
jgi:hypothetical protein